MNTFWRKLFAPEVIFTASAMAALSPYVFWHFGYKPRLGASLEPTYIPALLWSCGLLSFLAGCRLVRKKRGDRIRFRLSQRNIPMTLLLGAGLAAVLIQVYFAVQEVYGAVPLFDYLSTNGGVEVGTANEQQRYSGFGQLGLLTASLYALNALFLLLILQWLTWRRGSRILIALSILAIAFAHLLNAKRQGLYSALFYLLVGLSIYFGDPIRPFSALLHLRGARMVTKLVLFSAGTALIIAFGYIASIRTRGRVEASTEEIVTYLQYPLLNFEAQCVAAGLGPGDYKLWGPLRNLTPYKFGELTDAFSSSTPKLVSSAPAGIYESIHWCWGITGVILYSFGLGLGARWLYDRSLSSLTCLLSYCYSAVALAMAHSNNQVLILSYIPVPLFFVLVLRLTISTERGTLRSDRHNLKSETRQHRARIWSLVGRLG